MVNWITVIYFPLLLGKTVGGLDMASCAILIDMEDVGIFKGA